jgi:hypothetical protein
MLTSTSCGLVGTVGKPFLKGSDAWLTDEKTMQVERYIKNYLLFDSVSVRRRTDEGNKLTITVSTYSTAIHKLGQYLYDCMLICKAALDQSKEELLDVAVYAEYENDEALVWSTENLQAGKLRKLADFSNYTEMTLSEVFYMYSPKNESLPDLKPLIPKDPYKLYEVDETNIAPALFKLQEILDRNMSGIDYVLVENGREDPDALFIEVFATRFYEGEFGAIIQEAVGVCKEAMEATGRKLERFTTTMMLKGKENAKQSMQWITYDFVNGKAWDDFNNMFPEDGQDISFKDVVALYSPDNKDLL